MSTSTDSPNGEHLRHGLSCLHGWYFGAWSWEPQSNTSVWNAGLHAIMGTSPDTAPAGCPLSVLAHPDDARKARALLDAADSGDPVAPQRLRLVHTDGRAVTVEAAVTRCPAAQGQATSYIGTILDLTAQQQTEEALRTELERCDRAQEMAHFGYWNWDIATGDVTWSDEIHRIFGTTPETYSPHITTIMERTIPEDRRLAKELIDECVAAKKSGKYEQRVRRPDGGLRWFESSFEPIFDPHGTLIRILGTAHDITERKLAELEVRQREEQLRVTLHSIGDGVIATDAELNIVRMNPVAETITGWPQAEAIGHPLQTVFRVLNNATKQSNLPDLEAVLREGVSRSLEDDTILVARDGTERMVADRISPIISAERQIEGVVIIVRDITERRLIEDRLRQSQKMESIGLLAGGVAHDFNNMLGGILGAAELLQRRIQDNKELTPLVSIIRNAAENAAGLTQKLLAFSRKGKFISTPFDIHAAITDALDILERSINRKVRIERNFAAERSVIIGDPAQIQNAIINLGLNGDHAMPEGGTLTFTTRTTSFDDEVCARSAFPLHPGEYVEVIVRDTGIGIAPEHQSRIFEPFFTTKDVNKGTGLGLAAVYGTVKDHRGAITLESRPGEGTAFSLFFPLENIAAPTHRSRDVAGTETCPGTILLVDDEPILLRTASMILMDAGGTPLCAERGVDAISILTEKADTIDAVVLDMIMPELSGTECFEALRRIRPDIPILLCSGFTRTQSVNALLARGGAGFLKKPYHKAELLGALRALLREHRSAPGAPTADGAPTP